MSEEVNGQLAVHEAQGNRIGWGRVAATVLAVEVALVLSAFAWVVIYSYLIHPGETPAYYESHAQFASPIVSVVAGIPLLFFACRWAARRAGTRAVTMSLWIWFVLFLIDLALILPGQPTAYIWTMVAISHSTKFLAAFLGGRAAPGSPGVTTRTRR